MLKSAPGPIDIQDLQFKLHCRIKVFENIDNTSFSQYCSLVASASRFGLVFVGTQSACVQAIQTKNIENYAKAEGEVNCPRRNLPLISRPFHISVNCEHTFLAVVVEKNNRPYALFYDVKSFWQQEIIVVGQVFLSSTPGVSVTEVNWNPTLPSIFTACKSDGTLGIYEIKNTGVVVSELPAASAATCFCWSPKGKQIAIGSRDGKITQLKPDLKAVKVINAPPWKEPHVLQSLQWVSNYQFIGVFQPVDPDAQSTFVVIDSPKSGDPIYVRHDDICYSGGNIRPKQFYMILLQAWNILMAASSNSIEVGILGNIGEFWTQWIMGDAARAELPLSSNRQETLPIGCALYTATTQTLPWGESTLSPMPMLFLFSHHGLLCCFYVINLKQGIPSICSPPEPIEIMSGLQYFVPLSTHLKNNKFEEPINLGNVNNSEVTSADLKVQPQTKAQSEGINLFGNQGTPGTQSTKNGQSPRISYIPFSSSCERKTILKTPDVQTSSCETSIFVKPIIATSDPIVSSIIKFSQIEPNAGFSKAEVLTVAVTEKEETDKLFSQMVREECIFLESELNAILHQRKNVKFNLGSNNDKTNIMENTKSLEDFVHEVMEICVTQNAEVHVLKQNALQSWAWYEEAKSRHLTSEDKSLVLLMRSQALDSSSQKQRTDIKHSNYYLESQLSQAHIALDEQWENFQDYCKETHRIRIPTMEVIFQTMVKQNAILRKQSYILKDINNRIKRKSRSAENPSLLIPVNRANNLPHELKYMRMNLEDIWQIQNERIMNKMKHFSEKRVNNIRSFLKKREYSYISALKPQMTPSVIQASPLSKLKLTNSLSSKTPPIFKEFAPKELNLLQSTPKVISCVEGGTAIENLQNFALNFETKHFSDPGDKTFTPVIRNAIASSPNSAFVSTSFGSNTSICVSIPSTVGGKMLSGSSAGVIVTETPNSIKGNRSMEAKQSILTTTTSKPFSLANSSITSTSTSEIIPVPKLHDNMFPVVPPIIGCNGDTTSISFLGTANVHTKTQFSTPNVLNPNPNLRVVPDLNLTKSVASITSLIASPAKTSATINLNFGNTTTVSNASPTFLLPSSPNNFGLAHNLESPTSVTLSKSFEFSLKTTPTTIDTQNQLTSKLSDLIPKSQSVNFDTSTTEANKGISESQLPIFTAPLMSTAIKSGMQTSRYVPPLTFTTASSLPRSTQSSIFSNNTVTSTRSTVFSLSDLKPPLFTSISPVTTNGSIALNKVVVTCSSILISNSSSITTIVSTSSSIFTTCTSSNVDNNQTTSSKLNLFDSNVSPLKNLPATTGFIITPSNKSSIFGNSTVSSKSSNSGNTFTSAATTFENSSTSTTQSIFATVPKLSGFGMLPTCTAQSVIFTSSSTSANPTNPTASTTQTSIFNNTSQTSASFGISSSSTSQSSIFHTILPTTTSSASTTTQLSAFGVTSATSASFTSTISTSQIFGSAVSTPTTSLFGAPTGQSIFSSGATNQPSVFSNAGTSATSQSIFGNSSTTTSQKFGLFEDTSQKGSLFGSTNQTSLFGNSNNQSSSFVNSASSVNSIFNQNQTSSAFGSFGNSFSGPNTFGNSTQKFGQSTGSIFGNVPTSTDTGIFGETTAVGNTFASGGTIFGTQSSNASSGFGATSHFLSDTTQPSSFSANTNLGSFGFASLNVGSTTTTTASDFVSTPTVNPFEENKTIFGNSPTSTGNSVFGSNNRSLFGTSSNFGSGFGSQTPFSQQAAFSQGSFGSSNFGQVSSGPFTSGSSGTVGQTGFGTNTNFQKSGTFGSPPAFGVSPTFGSAPSFGGAPSFGNPATFGSPSKVFGSQNSGFGNNCNSPSAGFGTLANQPTVGFGNLAQATNSQTANSPFSGSSSFSSWR